MKSILFFRSILFGEIMSLRESTSISIFFKFRIISSFKGSKFMTKIAPVVHKWAEFGQKLNYTALILKLLF